MIAEAEGLVRTGHARAHPSLAIAKYWGKQRNGINIAATPSVAVTLEAMTAETTVRVYRDRRGDAPPDRIVLDDVPQEARRFRPFFDAVRADLPDSESLWFEVESRNDFPTAAGLASSAAGFAALAAASCVALTGAFDAERVSRLARIGSGSACRSVYGGFTRWDAGSLSAVQLHPEEWWPDLRVVVLPVTTAAKPLSSREAMNRTRDTSPYYFAWTKDAPDLAREVEESIRHRDLQRLGEASRTSYLRMFATMISATPPVLYWRPESVEIIRALEELRAQGVPAWETMDAGPQVKVFTDRDNAQLLVETFRDILAVPAIISAVGPGATVDR